MAHWKVKVNAHIPEQDIEFEMEVEADSKKGAEAAAEDEIDDYELSKKIDYSDVAFSSEATEDEDEDESEAE